MRRGTYKCNGCVRKVGLGVRACTFRSAGAGRARFDATFCAAASIPSMPFNRAMALSAPTAHPNTTCGKPRMLGGCKQLSMEFLVQCRLHQSPKAHTAFSSRSGLFARRRCKFGGEIACALAFTGFAFWTEDEEDDDEAERGFAFFAPLAAPLCVLRAKRTGAAFAGALLRVDVPVLASCPLPRPSISCADSPAPDTHVHVQGNVQTKGACSTQTISFNSRFFLRNDGHIAN